MQTDTDRHTHPAQSHANATPGSVSAVRSIDTLIGNVSSISATQLFPSLWPNEIATVPNGVFDQYGYATVCGGFLVPTKSTGSVAIVNLLSDTPAVFDVSPAVSGYFYHMALWRDMNGDGVLDIVSAQATKPIFGSGGGRLVWLENPGTAGGPLVNTFTWALHDLMSGPDVFFRMADLDGDGAEEVVAAEFFSGRISIWRRDPGSPANQTSSWSEVVVDTTVGPPFDVSIVDLNMDGRPELLATNHVNNVKLSGVFAYELPDKIVPGATFTRHTLYQGFKVRQSGPNQAAPGSAIPVWPFTNQQNSTRPSILIGGDGAEEAYLLSPNSQSPSDWTYSIVTVVDVGGTVGQVLAADLNGDGATEFLVPNYTHGQVLVYTFAP
jgi:hypothetical protein